MILTHSITYGQTLLSARTLGISAYTALVRDGRGADINQAGLTGIRDWEFGASTYAIVSSRDGGFAFHGISFGKRFLDDHAVGMQYSPGALLEFIIPTSYVASGSIDTRLSFEEPFALGYAFQPSTIISMGVGLRLRTETIRDTELRLDSNFVPSTVNREHRRETWSADVGTLLKPNPSIGFGVVVRNIARLSNGNLPADYASLALPQRTIGELGIMWNPWPSATIALDADTRKTGAFGMEWMPTRVLAVRAGSRLNVRASPFVEALSVGAGVSYEFLEIDIGYLRYLDREKRSGSIAGGQFETVHIDRIDLSPFSRDRIALSLKAVVGKVRDALVRIERVEMLGGVYPSSHEVLAYRPIGKVVVRNISSRPVQARARFHVEQFMDSPTESQPVFIAAGDDAELPLMAVFNSRIKDVSGMTVRDADILVSATPAEEYDDRHQVRVLIYGRNDWDGDVYSLRYFVTPGDPAIVTYTRDALREWKDSLDRVPKDLLAFHKARLLCNTFAGKLMYVADPKQSADYVQYPVETLTLRGGDCDDMTVCFSSLLNSIGISTAFVDVIPPEAPQDGHIFLLFDTGLAPALGHHISDNPKRYVVRTNRDGVETIWVPVETTVIMRGFDEAWTAGAQRYFDEVELGLGLVKGWVRIVDVY